MIFCRFLFTAKLKFMTQQQKPRQNGCFCRGFACRTKSLWSVVCYLIAVRFILRIRWGYFSASAMYRGTYRRWSW